MEYLLTIYHSLARETLDCLEVACRLPGHVLTVSEEQISRLVEMGLLEFRGSQGWQANWWGWAVLNWHRQVGEARERNILPPEPRELENGVHPGPSCDEFRPLLFSGVRCWCGRLRSEHGSEAAETAWRYLQYQERNGRLPHLKFRISGRSFRELGRGLPTDIGEMLGLMPVHGVTLHRLFHSLGARIRFQAVQEGMNWLLEEELVYYSEGTRLWYPGWDGLGVINWLQEKKLRRALGKPMSEIRRGENGESVLPSVCLRYRPLLFKESRVCWCGHLGVAHADCVRTSPRSHDSADGKMA